MFKPGLRIRLAASASIALAGTSAGAMPPPVEVAPIVISGDDGLALDLSMLIRTMGTTGHFSTTPADPALALALASVDCALDDRNRERCFAEAAAESAVPNLVYVIAEPAGARTRVSCIARDGARSRQAELSIAIATGDDAQAALQERSALSGCIIGALHGPRRD